MLSISTRKRWIVFASGHRRTRFQTLRVPKILTTSFPEILATCR
jgi:hypothetical protein